ncbi:MAG: peptidylprolyl isomerase, partial [Bryobacteraceae bacterium]
MIAYRPPLWPVCAAIAAALMLGSCSNKPPEASAPDFPKEAPAQYRVKFETSKGDFVVLVTKAWSPNGASRFWELVQSRYYDGCRFFRVVPNFVVQFGINGTPDKSAYWRQSRIPDDPVKESNTKGRLTFAAAGPASRTMQVFVNLRDNVRLDKTGFAPFGEVVSGMDIVESLYSGYGEGHPRGNGPKQDLIQQEGNAYLEREFPR